jgi:release factor glutamine methyltransferase
LIRTTRYAIGYLKMSMPTDTIAAALAAATDSLKPYSSTPRLDAELLLAHALGWTRTRVVAEAREPLPPEQARVFEKLLARRRKLEPVAYLTGRREFFGLDFVVDRRVLVPRPETELLVELTLAAARRIGAPRPALADIGTGSGCIAVALAANLPHARVYAVDCSRDALAVAAQNITRHGLTERVTLLHGDLTEPLPEPVDLLVSNPPYTILPEIEPGVRLHEPQLALDGGADGLDVYRRLLPAAARVVRPGGGVLLEIGATQGAAVSGLARASFPHARVAVHTDLAGLDRVVTVACDPLQDAL